jgi:hypothetical protein
MKALDNPQYLMLIILLLGGLYGGYTFYLHSQSQNPDWQTDVKSTDGFPPYRLNVWSYPHPPTNGTTVFAVEYDFINIMNKKVGNVSVAIKPMDRKTAVETHDATYEDRGRYKERYRVEFTKLTPGKWVLIIRTDWKGRTTSNRIEFSVSA